MAEVRFRRGEIAEAEGLCTEALELVSETESRVSRLWLGPLYVEVFLAAAKRTEVAAQEAAAAGNSAEAKEKDTESGAKRAKAREHLVSYQELVAACQSPRFTREASRLTTLLGFD